MNCPGTVQHVIGSGLLPEGPLKACSLATLRDQKQIVEYGVTEIALLFVVQKPWATSFSSVRLPAGLALLRASR